jgi:predicted glycosyltransferase
LTHKFIFLLLSGKVLIAALDWGMGHATRCVPLINHYLKEGNEVVLASNGTAAEFFASYYPQLEVRTDIPAYDIRYPTSGSMTLAMLQQAPRIMRVIRAEQKWLEENNATEKWDRIISDNRYGLHHPSSESVLVTHQLYIRAPLLARPILDRQVRKFASNFHKIWIPDFAGSHNLSGALSHSANVFPKSEFISPLSRFKGMQEIGKPSDIADVLALISGPEPQRSILTKNLVEIFKKANYNAIILGGLPGKMTSTQEGTVRLIPHLPDSELAKHIKHSKTIVCRSGYSTLMDLHALGRKAVLIPTPGQTEQEYLGAYHSANHGFVMLTQNRLEVATLAERLQTLQLNQG